MKPKEEELEQNLKPEQKGWYRWCLSHELGLIQNYHYAKSSSHQTNPYKTKTQCSVYLLTANDRGSSGGEISPKEQTMQKIEEVKSQTPKTPGFIRGRARVISAKQIGSRD